MSTYLSGTAKNPFISSHFLVRDVKLNEYSFENCTVNALYEDAGLSVEFDLIRNEKESINGSALLPMNLSFADSNEILPLNEPVALYLKSDKLDISFLQNFIKDVRNVKGSLIIDVNVKNTLANPQLSGFVNVRDGQFRIPKYGVNYKDFQLKISADSSRTRIDKLLLKSGGGSLTAGGYADFEKHNLKGGIKNARINIAAHDFLLADRKDLRVRIAGDVHLKGDLENPRYDGSVTIPSSRFYLSAFQSSGVADGEEAKPLLVDAEIDSLKYSTIKEKRAAPVPIRNLRGNLKIEIPRNTWLRGPDMNIEIAGLVNLVKEGANFELFGTIHTIRGTYDLYGRRFDIRRGTIAFDGGTEFNPQPQGVLLSNFQVML